MRPLFLVLRAIGAILIAAAIVVQFVTSRNFAESRGITDHTFMTVNFFSYFTIDSNVLAVVALALGVVVLARGGTESHGFAVFRGCVVTYMTITGIVYNLLLRGIDVAQGAVVPWSNEVLHVIGPLLLVVDWLFAPGHARLRYRDIRVVVIFPLAWVAYTLLRGPVAPDPMAGRIGWYPYPFLDPRLASSGYLSVTAYVLVIAAGFVLVGLAAIALSRRRPVRRRRTRRS